jgi:hypothetical protein
MNSQFFKNFSKKKISLRKRLLEHGDFWLHTWILANGDRLRRHVFKHTMPCFAKILFYFKEVQPLSIKFLDWFNISAEVKCWIVLWKDVPKVFFYRLNLGTFWTKIVGLIKFQYQFFFFFGTVSFQIWGHAVTQLVEVLCYKPEGRRFHSCWGNRIFQLNYRPEVDSASNWFFLTLLLAIRII